jgi:hypothetical protein
VVTAKQELPYGQLTWENFEKLCIRLLLTEADIRECRQYGVQGSDQQGIDLFALRQGRRYTVCQCKKVAKFGPAHIRSAVRAFLAGEWMAKSDRLILAMQDDLRTKKRSDAVVQVTEDLAAKQVELEVWDRHGLDNRLKAHPEIVSEFFHPAWAEAFCGKAGSPTGSETGPVKATEAERSKMRELILGMTQ